MKTGNIIATKSLKVETDPVDDNGVGNRGYNDDRYCTGSEADTISGTLQTQIDGKSDTNHLHDDRYYTETEVDTISGTLQTNVDNKPDTLLDLTDTPNTYEEGEYLRSTTSGVEWTIPEAEAAVVKVKEENVSAITKGQVCSITGSSGSKAEAGLCDCDDVDKIRIVGVAQSDITQNEDGVVVYKGIITSVDTRTTNTDVNPGGETWSAGNLLWASNTSGGMTKNRPTSGRSIKAARTVKGNSATDTLIVICSENPVWSTAAAGEDVVLRVGDSAGANKVSVRNYINNEVADFDSYGNLTISGSLAAHSVEVEELGSATHDDIQDWLNNIQSSGYVDGGILSDHGDGSVDYTTIKGYIKITDSDIATTKAFDLAGGNVELTDNNANYIHVNYNDGTPQVETTIDRTTINLNTEFTIGRVYRVGTELHIAQAGIQLANTDRKTHERLVYRGFERAEGGIISSPTGLKIASTAGVAYIGSSKVTTSGINTNTGDTFAAYYYDGDLPGGADWVTVSGQTDIDNTNYNDIDTGLNALTANRYGVHWVWIHLEGDLHVVYGRGNYTLAQAETVNMATDAPSLVSDFGIVAAKIIVKKSASDIYSIVTAYEQLFPISNPTDHNDLGGLDVGDYQHLTAAQKTDLTDGNDCSVHKHDDRYYTETEVNTISGTLQTDINTKLENTIEDVTPELGGDLSCGGYNLDNVGKFCSSSIATQIYNDTGATLVKGTAVTICGLNGAEVCTVCKTDNREVTKMPCCGIIYADIANGDEGCGIRLGRLNMDTSGMAGEVKDRLYVQSDGSLDTTIPTSGMVQRVGFLVKKAAGSAGRICICIRGPRSMYSAKDQHPIIRMGDDAGHQKIVFRDYINNEVCAIDSNGNITTSGTVDGVDVATLKSDFTTHSGTSNIHTELDDTVSGTENLWSASKIVSYASTGAGGGLSWEIIDSNTNAIGGNGYLINASGGNITLTLASSPDVGDPVGACDVYNKATTNTITIGRNGNNIEGAAEDLVIDIDGSGFTLVYTDSTRGWEIVSEIGGAGAGVSDTAYAASWNGITNIAPSKNAVFDKIETLIPASTFTADGEIIVGTGAGTYQAESGPTARLSLGISTALDAFSRSQFVYSDTDQITCGAASYLCKDKYCYWVSTITTNALTPAANDWFYLYLDYSAITSGTVITASELIWSTTEPTLNTTYRHWMNGDDRCIFAVRTDGSSNILEFFHDGNLVVFANNVSVTSAVAPGDTWTDSTQIIPIFSRVALITTYSKYISSAANFFWRINGQTGSTGHLCGYSSPDVVRNHNTFPVITDSSGIIEFKFSAGSNEAFIYTNGWYFPMGV